MSNKASITSKVNADLADSSDITATEHRSVLHTDDNSFLEAIYKTPIVDNSSGTTSITTSNANFNYEAKFTKVGNLITISGTISVISSQPSNSTIFTLTDTDYSASSDLFDNIGKGSNVFDYQDTVLVRMIDNEFKIVDASFGGELFIYKITYTAIN